MIRNAQRQERWPTRKPPSTGPIAAVTEVLADQVPMARPRESLSKAALIMARLPGVSSAAAAPWKARATISTLASGAAAHAAEVTAKSATPAVKTRRRPRRSPRAPPTSSSDASSRA